MLRALGEYEIEGLKTLIPFHTALLATEQWAQRRDLPRPARGQDVAQGARRSTRRRRSRRRGRGRDASSRPTPSRSPAGASTSRSSARRVGGGATARAPPARPAAAAPRRERARGGGGGGGDALASPLQGNMWKVLVEQGADRRGGPARLHHRGDEDGERDHRPQGGRRSPSCRSRRASAVACGAHDRGHQGRGRRRVAPTPAHRLSGFVRLSRTKVTTRWDRVRPGARGVGVGMRCARRRRSGAAGRAPISRRPPPTRSRSSSPARCRRLVGAGQPDREGAVHRPRLLPARPGPARSRVAARRRGGRAGVHARPVGVSAQRLRSPR